MRKPLLKHPPTTRELERLYWELAQEGAPSVGKKARWPYSPQSVEHLIALAGDMLRYDPRLLSILLQFVLEQWQRLNPRELRQWMITMRWPQALLVVFEFAKTGSADPELRALADYVGSGWPRVDPPERFFFDAERPASRTARRKAGRNLRPYSRWGFVASERPTMSVFTKQTLGSYDSKTRKHIRQELAQATSEFSLADYLDAVDNSISRQQAYHDLRDDQSLALVGRGRGARWRQRKRRRVFN